MNYPRFDKPTYVGTFNTEQSGFVLDSIPEPGFYFVVMNDPFDESQISCMFTISKTIWSYASFYSSLLSQVTTLTYTPGDGNLIGAPGGAVDTEGSTIEFYKIN